MIPHLVTSYSYDLHNTSVKKRGLVKKLRDKTNHVTVRYTALFYFFYSVFFYFCLVFVYF